MLPAVRIAAYGSDDSRGGDAALPSALHVGGIELDVGYRKVFQGTFQQLLDIGIEAFGLCCSPGPPRACLVPILSAIL